MHFKFEISGKLPPFSLGKGAYLTYYSYNARCYNLVRDICLKKSTTDRERKAFKIYAVYYQWRKQKA